MFLDTSPNSGNPETVKANLFYTKKYNIRKWPVDSYISDFFFFYISDLKGLNSVERKQVKRGKIPNVSFFTMTKCSIRSQSEKNKKHFLFHRHSF